MHVSEMLDTSPAKPLVENDALVRCIEACFDCAHSCNACADACLGEQHIDMLRRCIRLNQDCADICIASGNVLSRQVAPDPQLLRAQLEVCLIACLKCGEECAKHAKMHEHCRVCAEACRACAQACQAAIAALGSSQASTVRA